MVYLKEKHYICNMIELARHIEVLLLENDCVIVPDLGGFVAHYTPSQRLGEENRFLPPTRVIGFNPQLKMNDGLLVQSYMSVYNTNFADATRMVNKQVKELTQQLHEDGRAHLPNVGELHCSMHGNYDFVPYDHKITTPYLYGLDSFEMRPLASIHTMEEMPGTSLQTSEEEQSSGKKIKFEIRIKPSYLIHTAAMIAIILSFFLLSTPIENTEVVKGNQASLFPDDIFKQIGKQSLAITPIVTASKQASPAPSPVEKQAEPKPTQPSEDIRDSVVVREKKVTSQPSTVAVAQPARKKYHIIVASMSTEKEARAMASQLVNEGFRGANAIIGGGKMRVSIESCATQAEAYQTLNEVRKNEAYQNAWVLKY